jgi:hypothetical protein
MMRPLDDILRDEVRKETEATTRAVVQVVYLRLTTGLKDDNSERDAGIKWCLDRVAEMMDGNERPG